MTEKHILDEPVNLTPESIGEALQSGSIKIGLEVSRVVYGERDGKRVIESCVITGASIVRAD